MKQSKVVYWLLLFPCLLTFSLAVVIPSLAGLWYSFTDWDGIKSGGAAFVGLKNYISIVTADDGFIRSFVYTFIVTVICVLLVNLLAFLLALLVTSGIRGENLLRSIFFMPNLIGGVLIGFSWRFVFTQVFDAIGRNTGIEALRYWLSDGKTGTYGMIIITVWGMAGYMMLIYIAQLVNVPDNLLESAAIDGASGWKRLRHIQLPLMRPAFTIGVFLTLSNCFKIYDTNLTLTGGGPYNSTEMLAMNIFRTAFTLNNLGEAQAKAVVFLIIIMAVTGLQLYFSKKGEVEM